MKLLYIKQVDGCQWIEVEDGVIIGVSINKHKPNDLNEFWDNENELRNKHNGPAIAVGDLVTKHEAPHPNNKRNDGEFPQINQGNGEVLYGCKNLEKTTFRSILQKFKYGSFTFNKGFFCKQEEKSE